MKIAIVTFAYNRVDLFTQMLQSLLKCTSIDCYDLWIFSDGPKDELDKLKVEKVREVLSKIDRKTDKQLFVIKSESNKGLAKSVIEGVNRVFEQYDAVICIEDDLLLRVDFIDYMVDALNTFENDDRIWSISGFTPYLKALDDYPFDTFLGLRASSWGWATWKNRWDKVDWKVSDYHSFKNNKGLRKKAMMLGNDFPFLLDFQMSGIIDSWAVRWCYSQWKNSMLTVFPRESRVRNIGFGTDATHSKKQSVVQQNLSQQCEKADFLHSKIDERIIEEYRDNLYINPLKAKVKIILSRIYKAIKENKK